MKKTPTDIPPPARKPSGEPKEEAQAIAHTAGLALPTAKKFEKLADIANLCTMCSLWKNRTHAVFGAGNLEAGAMLIGEGPGVTEDKTGLPFVGSAGRHLDRVLFRVGLDRNRLYVTNIVKCHHRGQKPTVDQIDACHPYLDTQIKEIQPKFLVLVGSSPLKGLRIEGKITDIHGSWLETPYPGIKAMAVFHPSYLIYRESLNEADPLWQVWEADWRKIKQALDGTG